MPSIELGEHRIEYSVAKGRSRRYTYFRFRDDMTLEIVLPRGRAVDLVEAIRSRRSWILRQYEELARSRRILEDERVMFDGRYLRIVFEEGAEGEGLRHDPVRGEVVVRATDRARVGELVRRWFLKETSRYVMGKLSDVSRRVPARYRRADVREIRHWGYCTRDGRLSFSWQLIALPERLREYVVLHELAHLHEFNHSPAFRRRLAASCPDYRERERELDGIVPLRSVG